MLTQAIHTLDVLVWLAGLPAEVAAYANTSSIHRMEAEDIVGAAIRYANGATGTIAATTCAYPGFADRIDIIGENGTATILGSTLAVAFHDGAEEQIADDAGEAGVGADPMAFSHDQHRSLIADFVDAVRNGRQPRANGVEALKVHILIDALTRSVARGGPVAIAS
jgi:predicted dehydrogenase